jgi:DNA-binding transcriptional regulator LsrR (DeoR family)
MHKCVLMSDPNISKLADVARAYYLENRTQSEISNSMGISRSQVSRYLTKARKVGIVQTRIISLDEQVTDLAQKISLRYPKLRDVIVAPVFNSDPEIVRSIIGRYGANYLKQSVQPGQKLALGCGRTLRALVSSIPNHVIPDVVIVQAMGNLGHEAHQIDYNEIARDAADTFGGRLIYMSAPAILGSGSGSAKNFISNNPMLAEALKQAKSADIFVVGLGSMESDLVYTRFGLIKEEEFADLRGQVVGDICGRFFDTNGTEKPTAFTDRLVGVELTDIQNAPISIGIAGGPDKVAPILGAIRGNYINVLISDEQTVHSILALDDAYPAFEKS